MKIIDENGAAIETPDLMLGYLVDDTEPVEHPAVEAVEELSHYETVAQYPNGGKDVRKVIDRAAVPAAPAWTEQLPIRRYIRYTAEELAQLEKEQQEARQQQEALDNLPQTLESLQKENEMLRQCLLEMSETVYA
nr:MAG TPA: Transcription factor HY5 leucine zipper, TRANSCRIPTION.0A [Caudoviricetes sp.]DAG25403.1 MAG TPA: Transcription factor HY5 leucine zipper, TRANSCRIPTION.0A [Bacteriophage sp.]